MSTLLRACIVLAAVLSVPLLLASIGCSTSESEGSGSRTGQEIASSGNGENCCASKEHKHTQEAAIPSAHENRGKNANPGVRAALAKLSDEDRALAEEQGICPVTDEPLGSMGVPCKVTLKTKSNFLCCEGRTVETSTDRTVFICCAGCEDELRENADKYLAKLKKADAK